MDEIALPIMAELWEFLFANVYEGTIAKEQSKKHNIYYRTFIFIFVLTR